VKEASATKSIEQTHIKKGTLKKRFRVPIFLISLAKINVYKDYWCTWMFSDVHPIFKTSNAVSKIGNEPEPCNT
jgi:hypothetical protein